MCITGTFVGQKCFYVASKQRGICPKNVNIIIMRVLEVIITIIIMLLKLLSYGLPNMISNWIECKLQLFIALI